MDFEYHYSEDCVFKKVCPRKKRIGCDPSCTIQPEFYYLLETSNIPENMKGIKKLFPGTSDLEAFEELKEMQLDIENFVDDGRTLYLWSKHCGQGKSESACKLLKAYFATVCIGNGFRDRGYFAYVPSLLLSAKEFENKGRIEKLQALNTLDLVVLDDVGAVQNSSYDITILSNIIDTRYRNGKATIYTSNLSPSDLKEVISTRLKDRICSDIVIELKGNTRRQSTDKYVRRGKS